MEKEFVWCLHCERVHEVRELYGRCPLSDCDGTFLDFCDWKQFRESRENWFINVLPLVPVEGEHYSQYGDKKKINSRSKK